MHIISLQYIEAVIAKISRLVKILAKSSKRVRTISGGQILTVLVDLVYFFIFSHAENK